MIATITQTVTSLQAVNPSDHPAVHALASVLAKQAKELMLATQPGVGAFKFNAAARKALTKPANTRKGNPSILIGVSDHGANWHGDGCYTVKGEPTQAFAPFDIIKLDEGSIQHVVWSAIAEVQPVTITGTATDNKDEVIASNGARFNRTYLAYCQMLYPDAVMFARADKLAPMVFYSEGFPVALVMPVYCY